MEEVQRWGRSRITIRSGNSASGCVAENWKQKLKQIRV